MVLGAAAAIALAANKKAALKYAIAFAGLIGVFILAHFGRSIFHVQGRRGTFAKTLAVPFRLFRKVFLRKLPKVSSGGHLLLIITYCGLNATITFFDVKFEGTSPYSFFAKRCGWMALCNAGLAFLLAMKNTPLAFLTGYSHERLNVLHRWVGRTIWFYSCLHIYTYTAILRAAHSTAKMKEEEQIFGWIAFAAFNIIYASSMQFIRRRFYETFYLIHVAMFIVAVVFVGLHKPHKYAYASAVIGSLWCIDRLIRTTRLIYYSFNNNATLVPLSGLATKVIFEKPIGCVPGSHAFITIPGIRKFQSHPFTISSSDRIEFVIRAQKGFTLDLHKYALKHPYKQVKAYIDGPYGAVPDFKRMNKVVLFAGGSGGAFLFPIAVDIVRNAQRSAVAHLEVVWVIKDERHLTWYEDEIKELKKSSITNLSIYVTSKSDTIATSQPPEEEAAVESDVRRSLYIQENDSEEVGETSSEASNSNEGLDTLQKELGLGKQQVDEIREKRNSKRFSARMEAQMDQRPMFYIETLGGRPDLTSIVGQVVKSAEQRDTVAVGACGPTELMRVARNAVADNITITGPSITLHCEQFGWG